MDVINISHDCVIHKELSNNININNIIYLIRHKLNMVQWVLKVFSLLRMGGGGGIFGFAVIVIRPLSNCVQFF